MLRVQSIAVDVFLSDCVELMEEFKKSEHTSWDLDQEIQTWKKRIAMLAKGDREESEEEDDESTLMAESPK